MADFSGQSPSRRQLKWEDKMNSYRRLAVVMFVLFSAAVAVRWGWVRTARAESQSQSGLVAQASQSPRQPGQQASGPPPGTPGPARQLLAQMGVNRSDFGIKVVQTFDTSG